MNLANSTYDELIISYLEGRCSDEEVGVLLSWIAESESNQAYFDSFNDVWRLTSFEIPQEVDIDSALDSVNAKIEAIGEEPVAKIVEMPWLRRNYRYVSGIAAAVVVALFLGFLVRKPLTPEVTMASSTPRGPVTVTVKFFSVSSSRRRCSFVITFALVSAGMPVRRTITGIMLRGTSPPRTLSKS